MAWTHRLAGGVAAFALSFSIVAGTQAGGLKDGPSAPPPAAKKWLPWYESGGFLSTEQHRGESNLFAPIWQTSVALLFFQGSAKYFEDDIQEGNFALGFRKMHRSGWNLGVWAGYDVRDSENDNVFSQISFGFEALSDRWDVRANGYVAISDPANSPETARVFLSGNNIFMAGGEEVPLSGFDGEVGYKVFGRRGGHGGGLKDGPAPHGRSHELRVYAGGFYFDDDDALEEVAGPRARVEWRVDDVVRWLPGSRLTFEGEFQYDDVREDQWEGGVRFRVPFGGDSRDARATVLASLTPQERRMTESIVRDVDIVTAESKEESVFDTLTGVNFDRVAFVNGGGDLQGTLNANGPNSLVILNGGVTNGSFVVGPSQTLQGGASTILVTGQRSGTTAGFTAPGSKPFLVQVLNQAVVTVDSNTHLAGLGIQGAGEAAGLAANDGVVPIADGVSNVAITDTTITDFSGRAIEFENNHTKILVYDTTVQRVDLDAIEFDEFNSNVKFKNVTVANVANRGFDIDNNNSNFTFENVTVANSANRAININNDAQNFTFRNVTVANIANRGFNINARAQNFTFENVTVTNTANNGIDIGTDAQNFTFLNVAVANTANNGFQFNDRANNVTFRNVTISDVTGDGIFFNDNNSNIAIYHTTIANAGNNGIFFGNNNSNLSIGHTTITNSGNSAIDIGSNNTNIAISNTVVDTTGNESISFNGDNSGITIDSVTVRNSANDGIDFDTGDSNIVITNTTVENIDDAALQFDNNHSNVTISNTTATNVGIGFEIDGNNTSASLSNLTITNATEDGIQIDGTNNTVTMNISILAGLFVDDVIDIQAAGNTLAGSGNLFNGAFGDQFCDVTGAQNGAFLFGGGATCP